MLPPQNTLHCPPEELDHSRKSGQRGSAHRQCSELPKDTCGRTADAAAPVEGSGAHVLFSGRTPLRSGALGSLTLQPHRPALVTRAMAESRSAFLPVPGPAP